MCACGCAYSVMDADFVLVRACVRACVCTCAVAGARPVMGGRAAASVRLGGAQSRRAPNDPHDGPVWSVCHRWPLRPRICVRACVRACVCVRVCYCVYLHTFLAFGQMKHFAVRLGRNNPSRHCANERFDADFFVVTTWLVVWVAVAASRACGRWCTRVRAVHRLVLTKQTSV